MVPGTQGSGSRWLSGPLLWPASMILGALASCRRRLVRGLTSPPHERPSERAALVEALRIEAEGEDVLVFGARPQAAAEVDGRREVPGEAEAVGAPPVSQETVGREKKTPAA